MEASSRIKVEDPEIITPAVPDVVYNGDDGLEVYEVETLIGATIDPPLYLYEKYSKTKKLKDAVRSGKTIKSLTIVLPNLTALPLYPRKLRERLKWASEALSQELYNSKVIIATININKWDLKTIAQATGR
jgi:hypothetical protein